jgi:hypothetical protein
MKKLDRKEWLNTLILALGIALLPPLWAVLSPYLGINTGAVALICAAIYVANGNNIHDGVKISIGFLCGDIWAYCVLKIMGIMQFNPDVELFITLFVMGGLAVIIGCIYSRWIYLPSWLCGWAIGLTIMSPIEISKIGSLSIQIGVSMLVGVWYVGVGVDKFQKFMNGLCTKNKANSKNRNKIK